MSGPVTGTSSEDAAPSTLSALANASDVDTGDTLSVTDVSSLPAGVTFDTATQAFTLDPANAAFQSLAAGADTTVTVHYKVSDSLTSTPASISWTISGFNDTPVVSGAVTGIATEGGPASALNALANASDVDSGDALAVSLPPASLPAGVSYDALSKSFTLDPTNAAFQSLASGASTTVSVNFDVSDGTTATAASVTWTVTGINDAPVVSGAVTDIATEGGSVSTLNALANASDADTSDVLSVTNVPSSLPAGVSYDAVSHTFTLDPTDAAFQSLAVGASTTVSVNFDVSDGTTATAASISWTVSGSNDSPVVSGAVAGNATEDGTSSSLNALANASDGDTGDTLSVTNVSSLPAGVSYDASAKSFTLDPSNAAFQSLGVGATTTVTVNFDVSDGTSTTPTSATWTVTGTNDAPVATAASVSVVSETATAVTLAGTDVDTGTTLTFSVASQPAHGQLTGTTPNLTYTPSPGYTGPDSFTFTVSDGALTSAAATVALNVAPANSAPTLSVTVGTPDASTGVVTGTSGGTDADGDTLTFSVASSPSKGTVSVDSTTGAFTYTPDAAARTAAAAPGATLADKQDSFVLSVSDGKGGSAQATVTVDVAPAAPAIPSTFTTRTTANGLGGINVNGVYAAGSTVYAATNGGLSISTDGGANFTTLTTANGLGNVNVKGVYAAGSTVYAARGTGGLAISTDGGATFTTRTASNGLGSTTLYGVYAAGGTVYAATSLGLSISTDGGATFVNRTTANGLGSNLVYGVYADGSTVYAATSGGLAISTDGGATFTNRTAANNGLGSNTVRGVYVAGSTVYAATGSGLSISTDGGATFTNRTTANSGLGSNLVYGVYAAGSTVYAATSLGLSISTDGGANFTNRTTANGLGNNIVYGVYAAGSTVYAATSGGLSISQ